MSVEKYMRQTEILDRLIILRPDYEYTISVAQRILGWSSFANSLTFDRLNNFLKEALERNPNDPLIHEAIGNQFQIDPKTHDLALKYLSNAIEIDPAYAVAYNVRGHCKILMDKYDEAIADFDKSLVLEPSFVNAAMQKIRCVRNLNRTAESKALLDQLIKQADLTSFDCIYAAGFYTEIGDKNASEKMIEKALQLEPANAFAYEKMLSIAVSENQLNFRDSIKRIVGKYKGKVAFHEEVSLDIVANLITGGLRHANKLCNQVDRGLSGTAKKLAISMASLLGDRKVVIRRINDLAETRVCIERYISNLNQAFRERNVTVLVPSNVTGSVHVLTSGGIVAVGPGEKVSIPCGGLFQGNTLFEDNPEFTHSVCYYTGKRTVLDQELWMVERIDSSREVLEFTTFKNEGESVWVPAGR
jgi:tetratricopeptide (TPR) repeat protein